MSTAEARYAPAAGRQAFTHLYDPVVALTLRERAFRGRLPEQVLEGLPVAVDVGSGIGSFAFAAATAAAAPHADASARRRPGRAVACAGAQHSSCCSSSTASKGPPTTPPAASLSWFADAGFAGIMRRDRDRVRTVWGSLELLSAVKPDGRAREAEAE